MLRPAKHTYEEVSREVMPAASLRAAVDMLHFVEKDLSLGRADLRFFKEVKYSPEDKYSFTCDKDITGRIREADLMTIWLNINSTPAEAKRTIAHEARHIWQMRKNGHGNESDARRYEEYAIRAYKL